jgi:hypothetical protein
VDIFSFKKKQTIIWLGAESMIMESFPFDQYRIKIITGERLKGTIIPHLIQNGYELIANITGWGEQLWIHSTIKNELNWTAYATLGNKIAKH